MRAFSFVAVDHQGRRVRDRIEAETEAAAVERITARGLYVIEVMASPTPTGRRLPRRDLAAVFEALASLVDLGVPMDRAVMTTADLYPAPVRDRLAECQEALRSGATLAGSLTRGGWVPEVALGILEAGERTGRLAPGLRQAAAVLESEAGLAEQLRQALTYPALLATAGVVSLVIILGVVVPRFAGLLEDLGGPPPPATKLLLGLSAAMRHWGLPLGAVIITLVAGAFYWGRTDGCRTRRDQLLLSLPVIGPIVQQLVTGRVSLALSGMLAAGVPLLTALRAAMAAAANRGVVARLEAATSRTAAGGGIARSLELEAALWGPAIRLIGIGEANGRLAEMTSEAGRLAQAEAARRLRLLVTLLEPGLILGFALLVGFVAAALLQAVYSLRPSGLP